MTRLPTLMLPKTVRPPSRWRRGSGTTSLWWNWSVTVLRSRPRVRAGLQSTVAMKVGAPLSSVPGESRRRN